MMGFGGWFRSKVLRTDRRGTEQHFTGQTAGQRRLLSRTGAPAAIGCALIATGLVSGCGFTREAVNNCADDACDNVPLTHSLDIDAPVAGAENPDLLATPEPLSVLNEDEIEFDQVTLQWAVRTALQNSKILRDLGGSILRSPNAAATTYDVALQEMDP